MTFLYYTVGGADSLSSSRATALKIGTRPGLNQCPDHDSGHLRHSSKNYLYLSSNSSEC